MEYIEMMYIALIDAQHEEIYNTRRSATEIDFKMIYVPDKGICMVNKAPLKWADFEGRAVGFGFYKSSFDPVPILAFAIDVSVPNVHYGSTLIVDRERLCFQIDPQGPPLPRAVPKPKSLWEKINGLIIKARYN